MNDKEKLESHKRMYLRIQEQNNKCFFLDDEGEKSDWQVMEDRYPELLNLVEDLISDLEKVVNKNERDKWMSLKKVQELRGNYLNGCTEQII